MSLKGASLKGAPLLGAVARSLDGSAGLARKAAVGEVARVLAGGHMPAGWPSAAGEDAAPVPFGDGYLLLAADGVASALLDDPFWAGYCGVLVNANDIAAMGGRPLAMVDVLAGADGDWRAEVARGMAFASRHLGIPVVGGHLHPDGPERSVSVAVLGAASRIVASSTARPGDALLVVVDTTGDWHRPFPNWDSTTHRSSEEARAHLALVPELAESGLLSACKDVSNPGLLGTLLMLLESSGAGAVVDVGAIPRPGGVELPAWLDAYPGCGFVAAVRPADAPAVLSRAQRLGLTAAEMGAVAEGSELTLTAGGASLVVWDHRLRPVTGIGA